MNKTPRTDAAEITMYDDGFAGKPCKVVPVKIARQLETELADKEKQLAEARAEIERKDRLVEQMREALEKCRDTFALYVLDHSGKLHITPIAPIDLCAPIREKIAKNQRMVDLCDAALAAERGE